VSIIFCQSEDLVDDRISWLLTNPENIDKLDEDKSKIIKNELSKILEKFNNEVKENKIFLPTSSMVKDPTSYEIIFNESAYLTALLGMNNPTPMERDYLKSMYTDKKYGYKKVIKRKGFDVITATVGAQLSTQIPEWSDIVEYYGGYNQLIGTGLKKENLEWFRVTKFLKRVEIVDENQCIAIIEIEGKKDYGLKFYNIEETKKVIYGIYKLDDFTSTDLYYIWRERASTTIDRDKRPKIEFKFIDQELVQMEHFIFNEPGVLIKPVNEINKKIIDLSKTYFSTIKMMIDDLVPLSYYNTLNHRKVNQRQLERKQEEAKQEAKRSHFSYFEQKRNEAVRKIKKYLFDYMDNMDPSKQKKKLKSLIKEYEKEKNKDELWNKWKATDYDVYLPDPYRRSYTDDFLEYYYNSLTKNKDAKIMHKIIAIREKVNKIGATTNCNMLRVFNDGHFATHHAGVPQKKPDLHLDIGRLIQCFYEDHKHSKPHPEWLPGINEQRLNKKDKKGIKYYLRKLP